MQEPISTIEDLDPDPPSKGGGRQLAKLALGLALLFAVLGFAGWQWLRQETQQREYAAGTEALLQQNLDEAQAHFTAASGYRDADAQAQAATKKVTDRDSQYRDALDYQDAGAWAACLKAIQQVSQIQPGYRNSTQIEQKAVEQVYRQAMSGTIALRANASPPGLYYYGDKGWAWLIGSDSHSKVWGETYGDYIVYDMADTGWVPTSPSPTPDTSGYATPDRTGRYYIAARLSDQQFTHPSGWAYDMPNEFLWIYPPYQIYFDPNRYAPYIVGKDGVWATEYGFGNMDRSIPIRNGYAGLHGTIAYQNYSNTITATIAIPDRANSTIMAVDPNGPRYLLARWDDGVPNSPATINSPNPTTITTLYLVDTALNQRRLVYTMKGGSFISAEFSPDGKRALLSTYTPYNITTEKQTVLLLDLQGNTAPRKLGEVIAQIDTSLPTNAIDLSWLTASFIESGPYSNQVALAEYAIDHYHIRVLNVEQESEPVIDVEVPTGVKIAWSVFQGNGNTTLIAGTELRTTSELPARPLRFVALPLGQDPKVTKLPVEKNSFLERAALIGERLVYSTHEYGPSDRATRSVYSFPIRRFGIEGERPWTMYKQTGSASGADIVGYGSHSFGQDLFAYISGGDLHARLYDGSVDVVLEHNITYLYSTAIWFSSRGALR